MPRDLMTSTMKSDPGFSMTRAPSAGAPASRAICAAPGPRDPAGAPAGADPLCCALVICGFAAMTAAPAAAPFKKPRRPNALFLDFAISTLLKPGKLYQTLL